MGASPQILTETLWALARRADPFWPDEVRIVTTRGAPNLSSVVFENGDRVQPGAKVRELCQKLGRPVFEMKLDIPVVRRGPNREPVLDIRTLDDAVAFGDCIAEIVREVTNAADSILHLSIAGGRKTMSYHAGAAMTLFGRAGDEMSHVLVTPSALEQCPDFWWPTRSPAVVHHPFAKDENGGALVLSTFERDVQITLVETPFVRVRTFLPQTALTEPLSFAAAVQRANIAASRAHLRIDLKLGRAHVGGLLLELTPSELALYTVFARRSKAGQSPLSIKALNDPAFDDRQAFERLREVLQSETRFGDDARLGSLNSLLSRLRTALNRSLIEPELVELFGVNPSPETRGLYAVSAPPSSIQISGEPPSERET